MSKTISIPVFKFSELSDRSAPGGRPSPREKARTWWIEATGHEISTSIHEQFIRELSAVGYPTERIEFSLSYCQGDGMAFYTGRLRDPKDRARCPYCTVGEDRIYSNVDLRKLFRTRLRSYFSKDVRRRIYHLTKVGITLDVEIAPNGYGTRYAHWNTMSVTVVLADLGDATPSEIQEAEDIAKDIQEAIQQDVKIMSKELEKEGYAIWEKSTSEETVSEDLDLQEIWFHSDGRVCRETSE